MRCIVFLLLLSCSVACAAEVQVWADRSGRIKLRGELVRIDEAKKAVVIRRADTKKEVSIPIERLTAECQKRLEKAKPEPEEAPQAVGIDWHVFLQGAPTKGTRGLLTNGFGDEMTIQVVQVIDETTVLGKVAGLKINVLIWVSGINTDGMVDGAYLRRGTEWVVVGTHRYTTTAGASKTIVELTPAGKPDGKPAGQPREEPPDKPAPK